MSAVSSEAETKGPRRATKRKGRETHEGQETLVRELRADLQTVADKFGDLGTNDFLTGLVEKHEKMAWMLRSFLP
jgi:starvation-inducible DNA-binding protein